MTVTPSITLITTAEQVAATAFDAVSVQNAGARDVDLKGMANQALLQLLEAKKTLTAILNVTDTADPQLVAISDMLASLV
jgi:hypothetical protein